MRRIISVRLATLAAGSVAALAAVAQGAQASYFTTPTYSGVCTGADNLHGLGASTQRSLFVDGFGATAGAPSPGGPNAVGFGYDAGADYANCGVFQTPADGGTKSLTYRATGSGSAIDVIGAANANDPRSYNDGTTTTSDVAFASSDDPPTDQQIAWAEQGPPVHPAEGQLLSIPVAQVAIAPVVRLPDGCQIADQTQRQLSRVQLSLAFEGVTSTWGDLFGTAITGDGTGPSSADCRAKTFTRVVRLDSSGSTFIFKRYLQAASHSTGGDSFDWRDTNEGGTLGNTAWPAGATTIERGAASGAGSLLDQLSTKGDSGGIGYADVATDRAKGYAWDQAGSGYAANDKTLWLRAQRISNDNYNSPGVANAQGSTGTSAAAACTNVAYSNQVTTSDLGASWFTTTAIPTPTDFPICGLTYQLVWMWGFDTESSRFQAVQAGSTQGEFRAERDFLRYELGIIRPGVGPSKLAALGYAKLPADVMATAQAQANKVGWLRASTDPQPGDPVVG
jgi:ABC-type phosphate transport system substrate-binding protein